MTIAMDDALKAAAAEGRIPPLFRQGEIVAVYQDPQQGMFISYGRVTGLKWSEAVFGWYYEIMTVYHHTTITHLQANLRLVSASEARQLLILIRNPLDLP